MHNNRYAEKAINTLCGSRISANICKKCNNWCLYLWQSFTTMTNKLIWQSERFFTPKSTNKLPQAGWWKQWFAVPDKRSNNPQADHCNSSIKLTRDLIQRNMHMAKRIEGILFPLGKKGKRMASELFLIIAIYHLIYPAEAHKIHHIFISSSL